MKKIAFLIFLFCSVAAFSQITVNTNFSVNGNLPIDARDTLTTLADTANVDWTYPGLLSYAVDVDQFWYYTGSFWKQLQTGSILNNYPGSTTKFASDTSVAPDTTGAPSTNEIEVWNYTTQDTNWLNSVIFYTGTDDSTDVITYVYFIDSDGNATLLESPTDPVNFTRRLIPSPAFANSNQPLDSEALTFINNLSPPAKPLTIFIQADGAVPGAGTSDNPETAWLYDGVNVTRVKDFPRKFEVPGSAFADSTEATGTEVLTWLLSNPQAGNFLVAYHIGSGTVDKPDFVWWLAGDTNNSYADIVTIKEPGGVGGDAALKDTISHTAHGFSVGNLINIQSVTGIGQLADADVDSLFAVGIITEVIDANSYVIQTSGIATISGVVAGEQYYTSSTAGAVTTTAPSKIQVAYQGIATNTARLVFDRFSQGQSTTYLTTVSRDATLAGAGTSGDPLRADTSILATLTDLVNAELQQGAGYKGNATTATNPGTPTIPVFYTTTEAGTYTNFDGLVVSQNFAILAYDTTGAGSWSKSEVDVLGARGATLDTLQALLLDYYTTTSETTKSYFSYTSNQSTSGAFCDMRQYINNTRIPDSLRVYAKSAGDFYVVYFSVSGNTATLLDTDTLTVVDTGIIAFKLNTVGLTLTSDSIYVALRTPTSGRLKFRTTTGTVFTVNGTGGGTVIWGTAYDLAYAVKLNIVENQNQLDTLLGLPARVDYLEAAVGTTTITGANLQAYINANIFTELPAGDTIDIGATPIVIPSNRVIHGNGAVIKGTGDAFQIANDTNIVIRGVIFVGDYTTPDVTSSAVISDTTTLIALSGIGADDGIQITGASNKIVIDNCKFYNYNRSGLYVSATGTSTHPREGALQASNLFAQNCYLGYYIPSTSEYNTLNNLKATNCLIGSRVDGGNNYFSNFHMNGNRVGLYLGGTGNNSHGSISSGAFNHNELYGIVARDILYGFFFAACQNFDGAIYLIRSVGFSWTGGYTDGTILYTGGTSNLFHSCIFGADGVNEGNPSNLSLKNNLMRSGASATGINN